MESLAKSLGIDPVPESVERLRKEIRAELRDLHPDRNAGDFPTQEARERFTELSTALAQIDGDGAATALVPMSTVAPLVSTIIEALGQGGALESREASPLARRQALRLEARDEARHRFQLSRYGSAGVGVMTTGLWLVPQLVAAFGGDAVAGTLQASILGPLFAHPLSEPILFGVALYSWLFFALTWFMEQNDHRRIDWVTTEEARGVLLNRAVMSARLRGDADTITRGDLRDALGRGLRPTFLLRILGARDVSASFLDRVAGQHVAELTADGVLTPTTDVGLSPRYHIDENVQAAIQPD